MATSVKPSSDSATETVEEPTIGRLVADASRDLSALVQHEIALAKAEMRFSVKAGVLGSLLFLVAGFLGILIIIMLSFAFAYFLTMTGLHPAWAFLIVAGAYLLLAGLLVVVGVNRIKKIKAPEATIETAKQIPAALKGQRPGRDLA
ncbi:phage holin family protein [Aeromicrobium sp. Leaf350]|uniref:phage holin family protein n=1 Tax=Aeromicrobium sp. Leaf350 TaxID=2876565 RepID=UPI001E3C63AD|nr:phage holin family protein [Aeromicrobium sp. Leaf350]